MTASKLLPDSVAAHYRQEIICIESLERLGEPEVVHSFFTGILEHDLWAHGAHLIRSPAVSDPRYAPARDLLQAILQKAPKTALDPLADDRRLTYAFICAGRWDFAAAVAAEGMPESLRSALGGTPFADLVSTAHTLTTNVNGILTRLFRTVAKQVIDPDNRSVLSDEQLLLAVQEIRDSRKAGIPRGRLTAMELAYVTSDPEMSAAALRRLEPVIDLNTPEIAGVDAEDERSPVKRPALVRRIARRIKREGRRISSTVLRSRGARSDP